MANASKQEKKGNIPFTRLARNKSRFKGFRKEWNRNGPLILLHPVRQAMDLLEGRAANPSQLKESFKGPYAWAFREALTRKMTRKQLSAWLNSRLRQGKSVLHKELAKRRDDATLGQDSALPILENG